MLARILPVALLAALAAGCDSPLDGAGIDTDRLCALAGMAYEEQDFSDLLTDLERQTGANQGDMSVAPDGVWIRMDGFFVMEEGYFVAKPGTEVSPDRADPYFTLLRGCLYRYTITG